MSEIQFIILSSVVVLTIISTLVALQVSLVFRDFKKVIERMDKVLHHLQIIASSLSQSFDDTSSRTPLTINTKMDSHHKENAKTTSSKHPSLNGGGKRFFKRKAG